MVPEIWCATDRRGDDRKSDIWRWVPHLKMECLDKIETMPSVNVSTITGTTILAGDTNINVNKPSRQQNRYQELFENINLVQHINLPTNKGTKIIDHVTNIPNKILHSNMLLCSLISYHDPWHIIAIISTNKYQLCYKLIIRDMKNLQSSKID